MTENAMLRGVSRSFYLTIRLLPAAMRDDIALGYLLARAADTVADAPLVDAEKRLGALKAAQASLGAKDIEGYRPEEWSQHPLEPAERKLLAEFPMLWKRMQTRRESDRKRLQTVLGHILEGQIFDLERFVEGSPPLTKQELERYTYLVAGSVGEFWTDLGFAKVAKFATETPETMGHLGRHYGQALQLVNILRDRRMDAVMGRIYVEEQRSSDWFDQANEWLNEGVRYCQALRSGRLRYACILPALLGWRTLALTQFEKREQLAPIKVPRAEAKRWMRKALAAWWSPAAIARLASQAKGLQSR